MLGIRHQLFHVFFIVFDLSDIIGFVYFQFLQLLPIGVLRKKIVPVEEGYPYHKSGYGDGVFIADPSGYAFEEGRFHVIKVGRRRLRLLNSNVVF